MSPRLDRRMFLLTGAGALAASVLPMPRVHGFFPQPAAPDAIDRQMPAWMNEFAVPGVGLAIIQRERPVWAKGYGVTKAGGTAPVTADTMFEAASLSKPVFAYLVLKLVEDGVIKLDESIGSAFRIPDFMTNDAVNAITPRIVLSHRTGLSNWRPAREPDRLRFTPGSAFSYSGEAYVRLQRAVEKITGKPLDVLAAERIFEPWKMPRSSYVWRDGFAERVAEGHDATGQPTRTRLWAYSPAAAAGARLPPGAETPPLFAVPNAAASLYSSAADYAQFVTGLLSPATADAAHIGSESLKTMLTPAATVNKDLSWGLGWGLARVGSARHFWHWGNNDVYQAFVTASPDTGEGVVMLTNGANGLRLARRAVTAVLGAEHPAFAWDRVIRAAAR